MFSKPHTAELIFFWLLFGAVGVLMFAVMSPYLTPLFLAFVFAILFHPLERRLRVWLDGNRTLSSLLAVMFVLLVFLIPLVILGMLMFQEVVDIYNSFNGNGFLIFSDIAAFIESKIRPFYAEFAIRANVDEYAKAVLSWFAQNLNTFFSGIFSFLFDLFIIVVAMFFIWRDGPKLRAFALRWSPLSDEYDKGIIAKLEMGVSSVVKGALTTAIVQGVLVGIGFQIFDVPNPVLWGVIASIAALIPFVGTALITMPAAAFLLFSGATFSGIGLILWALLCVGLSDNLLNPMLMKRGMDVHPFLILLSVFGGLAYFGPVGFLAGPITLAFFFALMDVYPVILKGGDLPPPSTPLLSEAVEPVSMEKPKRRLKKKIDVIVPVSDPDQSGQVS
jgi:predicted PurR-regulated permease PerM